MSEYIKADWLLGKIYDLVNEINDNAPTIEPKWIPCEERLPEEDGIYLVSVKQKIFDTEVNGVLTSFFSTRNGWLSLNNGYKVLAWMPLPPSYKGADECLSAEQDTTI